LREAPLKGPTAPERAHEDPMIAPKKDWKKMKRKIGLVFAVSIVALMAMGVTYGLWYETLYIYGTVCTGTLDAEWFVHHAWDDEPEIKDFSNITAMKVDEYTLNVVVDNAYPGICYYVAIQLTNTGTIPWKVYNPMLDGGNLTGVGTVEFVDPANVAPHMLPAGMLAILEGTQVHPGDSAFGVLRICLNNSAAELTTYTFSFKVVVEQWNEYPMEPPAGFANNEEWLKSLQCPPED
jgi:hypothetical protein